MGDVPAAASLNDVSHAATSVGDRMHALAARLYPICRSLTGDGVRKTLHVLGEMIPLAVHEVPSGTQVFDWVVPPLVDIAERAGLPFRVIEDAATELENAALLKPLEARGSHTVVSMQRPRS